MIIENDLFASSEFAMSEEELFELEAVTKQQEEDLVETEQTLKDMTHSLEIFEAISDTITKCGGVTKSLEVMFGENFTSVASMEAEATEKKDNIFKKLWDGLIKLLKKLVDWIKSLFKRENYMRIEMKMLARRAKKLTTPIGGLRKAIIKSSAIDTKRAYKEDDVVSEYTDLIVKLADLLNDPAENKEEIKKAISNLNAEVEIVRVDNDEDGQFVYDQIMEVLSTSKQIDSIQTRLETAEKKLKSMSEKDFTHGKDYTVSNDNGQGIDISAAIKDSNTIKMALIEACTAVRKQRIILSHWITRNYFLVKQNIAKLEQAANKTKSNDKK